MATETFWCPGPWPQVTPKILITVLAVFSLALSGCPDKPNTPPVRETRISILQINLRGILDEPFGDVSGNWITRYTRIGTDLRAIGAIPDVIALQEVVGSVWCPTNFDFIKDYEVLRTLILRLQAGTGIQYRIAYMQIYVTDRRFGKGQSVNGFNAHDCRGAAGLALLYNPNRIRNLMADTPQAEADGAFGFNQNRNGAYLRRSLPCCTPRPGQEDVCALIDGPIQNDKCSSKPAGLAWTAVDAISVARLALALRSDNTEFRVYNVHLAGNAPGPPYWRDATRSLIQALEIDQGLPRWITPIIVGDFNEAIDTLPGWLPDFDWRGTPANDTIIHTFTGKPASFSSRATIVSHDTVQMPTGGTQPGCKDANILWSDHCGSLTTLVIQEPR